MNPPGSPDRGGGALAGAAVTVLGRAMRIAAALVLLLLLSPLLAGIAAVILIADGRPILYRGRRLGRHKRPFTMFKFRTLTDGASAAIGGDLLGHHHDVVIPCGRFLRDTRLDELPQLFNIVRGDMNFFGPRPERPEVYERLCCHLDGYDRRFDVRPGLVGLSQLFTPHSAPKRLRLLIDNRVTRAQASTVRNALVVAYAGIVVLRTACARILCFLAHDVLEVRILHSRRNRRALRRARPRGARVRIEAQGAGERARSSGGDGAADGVSDDETRIEASIADINEAAFRVRCPEARFEPGAAVRLEIEVRFQRHRWTRRSRVRAARCGGRIVQRRRAGGAWDVVVAYDPASELARYTIHQYLLARSLASPFRR